MHRRPMVATPTFWVPLMLDQLIRHAELDFRLSNEPIAPTEMTHALGYGAVLGFLINVRVPGGIPLMRHSDSACGWQALYEAVALPVTIIGGAALDALHELRTATAPAHTVPLEPLCLWMNTILASANPVAGLITGNPP